jgi:hypothetical protein
MSKSIVELLEQLPVSATVGRTNDGYKGGWVCCSYYEAFEDYGLRHHVPQVKDENFFPVGYGTTPEEAIEDSIRQMK